MSKLCRQAAKRYANEENSAAAKCLYLKAIKYNPIDIRLFIELASCLLRIRDAGQAWKFPNALEVPLP